MRRWARRVSVGIAGSGIVAAVVIAIATMRVKLPGEEMTPAGIRRASSRYVKVRDEVELAVSVYLPGDLKAGERVPVLMRTTRYWREPQIGWPPRMLAALHEASSDDLLDKQVAYFNERRFAVLLVDARGSGASGGHRDMEYSPAEVADMGEVAAWGAQQPWSNGNVGTFGISYEGSTAELAAVPNQPAIRAVMPLYDDFDVQPGLQPGGVTDRLLLEWSDAVAAMDRNDVCGAEQVKGWRCWRDRLLTPGVRPVDADPHGKRLAEMLSQHQNINVGQAVAKLEFRDDKLGAFSMGDLSPYGLRAPIEASKVVMMVWCGWRDGEGCEGTLNRFRNFSNPQVVIIGPLSHGGDFNADPFATRHTPPVPASEEQLKMEADFFDRVLRNGGPEIVEWSIQYYAMGAGQWHTTKIWPPAGLTAERWYFADNNTLSAAVPAATSASDSYTVDFTASSGNQTIWHTGIGGGDVVYPDRAGEDRKLLVYTSEPLETDIEITGTPVVALEMSSTTSDGAVHAYLDEGLLRVIERKEVDPKSLPYVPIGPAHSFLRKDAEPLTPGQSATIRFAMYPTSVRLRKGHRIRVALAGADAGLFQRYPAEGTPTWTVYREAKRASGIELPVRRNGESSRAVSVFVGEPPLR